jgi:hypothetical protein
MYQHQVCLGFNPARVIIGTDTALPIKMGANTKLMVQAIDIGMMNLNKLVKSSENTLNRCVKKWRKHICRHFVH